ncbi:MAG: DUF4339 domain-containing protein [Rhodospirillales bacterium]|nr:DUF4339 domain-containing protein [Rhodospirillales bacterium]
MAQSPYYQLRAFFSVLRGKLILYYYHDGENEVGPFSADRLVKLASSGLLGAGTLVRAANNETWVPFGELELTDDADPSPAAETGGSLDGSIPPARFLAQWS